MHADFLIIGSGIAGLSLALKVAPLGTVCIVTKKNSAESNTNYAQGGIASVVGAQDFFDSHVKDTLDAGAGLCRMDVVERVVKEGPEAIEDLIKFGVNFTRNQEGAFDLGTEGGHSKRRVLHAGDFTGQMIEDALLQSVKQHPNIQILEHHFAIDIITSRHLDIDSNKANRALGAYVFDNQNKKTLTCLAQVTILASGGAGKVYLYTSNPDIATGDGIAMAWRAGAKVANLEFVQFHPTCLYHPEAKTFLLSEALRGEGGILRLLNGEAFMTRYDRRSDLAPRDIVARAIDSELKKRGEDYVLLDLTHIPGDFLLKRFPNISAKVAEYGYDIRKNPIPVVPAAHYMCGGVCVDQNAETNIQNLFACGEVSFTGLHGGNRLASNSLLEAVVYAKAAAKEASSRLQKGWKSENVAAPTWDTHQPIDEHEAIMVKQNWEEIRHFMWNYVGIVRSNKRLLRAKRRIELLKEEIQQHSTHTGIYTDFLELRNIACVAELIIRCALWRKESRGLHYTTDYPSPSESYRRDTILEP